jgi:hypothetical protein
VTQKKQTQKKQTLKKQTLKKAQRRRSAGIQKENRTKEVGRHAEEEEDLITHERNQMGKLLLFQGKDNPLQLNLLKQMESNSIDYRVKWRFPLFLCHYPSSGRKQTLM